MRMPFPHCLGHLVLITHSAHTNDVSLQLFERLGFHHDDLHLADQLLSEAVSSMQLVAASAPDPRIIDHEIHLAVGQVDQWLQALRITLSPFYDTHQLDNLLGSSIHGPTHPLTVIAQAIHLLNLVRTSPGLINQLGGTRTTEDHINRGWAMLNRIYSAMRFQLSSPSVQEAYTQVLQWLTRLNLAVDQADLSKEDLTRLVFFGFIPDGHGLPIGGTGLNIVLHQNAQGSIPDPNNTGSTSGWSIGRHGNRENLGKGWAP